MKNHEVDLVINVKKANGEIKIKTFTKIYLKEYEKIKLNNPKEIKDLIKPSTEKILKLVSSILITEFKFKIRLEKEISQLRVFFPISQIEEEIKELI